MAGVVVVFPLLPPRLTVAGFDEEPSLTAITVTTAPGCRGSGSLGLYAEEERAPPITFAVLCIHI